MKSKKLMAMLLAMLLLCTSMMPVFANGPSPGPTEYTLETKYILAENNAGINANGMVFNAGGSIKLEFLLPFDSDKLVISYSTKAKAKLSLKTDENEYVCELPANATSAEIAVDELYGSHYLTIASDAAVTISEMKFIKIDESFHENNSLALNLSDYEYALLNSVVFKNDASVVKSHGAMRRLSYDDYDLKPNNIEGSIYVPVKVLAAELGFYCEDYADKGYILLRGEGIDLELSSGKGYFTDDLKGGYEVAVNVVYSNGITWVPVRKISEIMNFTVEYREGYVVIDDRITAREVVENENYFSKLCEEFEPYVNTTVKKAYTYHVAQNHPKASDANSGTEEFPFLTLEKAASIATAGDTVIIHEGTYREVLAPKYNGTEQAPITFKAKEGDNVTISALEPATGFFEYKKGIYCATAPVDLGMGRNQIFYKGDALVEGRHPNTHTKVEVGETHGYPTDIPAIWPTKGNISIKVDNIGNTKREGYNIATSDTDLKQSENYWQGGTFVSLKGEAWTLVSGDIVSSKEGELVIADYPESKSYNLGIGGSYHFDPINQGYYRFVHKPDYGYITNHLNTVDMPGEWYMEGGVMYVYPPDGADLSKDFEVKQRQLCIDVRNKKYINIEGINTVGGGVTASGDDTEGCVFDDCNFRYISHFTKLYDPMCTYTDPKDSYLSADNSNTRGETSIFLGGNSNAVINSKIEYSAGAGVYMVGTNHYVYNNVIADTSYSGCYPSAITIRREQYEDINSLSGGHVVRNNTIYRGGRSSVFMGTGLTDASGKYAPFVANEFTYNRVFDSSITARDTGIFYQYGYTGGNDKRRTQVHHNYLYNLMNWDRNFDPWTPTNTAGIGTGNSHLYQDGFTANQDTFLNLSFQEYDIGVGSNGGIYEQEQPWTQVRQRANKNLHDFPGGIDALVTDNFPGGKPFYAGSFIDGSDRFMLNYNNMLEGNKPYYAEKDGDGYRFKGVGINEKDYYQLSVDYKRNGANTIFDAEIKVYDKAGSLATEVTIPMTTETAGDESELKSVFFIIPPVDAGKYDVIIKFNDASSELLRLRPAKAEEGLEKMIEPDYILGGTYDDWIKGSSQGENWDVAPSVNHNIDNIKKQTFYSVYQTWSNTVIFKNRTVKENADSIRFNVSSGTGYDGQILKIYADSLDSEPIAEIVIESTNWAPQEFTAKLKRELPQGEHTFWFEYSGFNQSSTLYYFDFFNSETSGVAE